MILLLAHHHARHIQQAVHALPLWQAAIGSLAAAFLLCAVHAAWKAARGTSRKKARRGARPAFDPYAPSGRRSPARGRR